MKCEQLHEAEQQSKIMKPAYRGFLDLVDSPLALFESGNISESNQKLRELFSCSGQDMAGQSLIDLSPDLQVDGTTSAEKAALLNLKVEKYGRHSCEWQFMRPDGSLFTADVCFTPTEDSSHQTVLATINKVPEPRHPEASCYPDKKWTETILQSIQSGIFIIDIETHEIIDINHAAEEMTGATRAEIIGNICHTFVCPKAKGNCPITDRKHRVYNAESVLLKKDGSRIPILKTVNSIILKGRECLIESFVDISALKNAQEEARVHQERFQTFFSSVNDAIFVHPLMEQGFAPFIEINNIACTRYGYSREEFLTLTAENITQKQDVDKHADSSHRKRLFDTKHMFFEAVHIKKSGETFPVEINSNIVVQHGEPIILTVVRDISERKQAEQDKTRMEAQYRQSQKVEAIGRLAGGVAHDLNNMLLPIIGYSELLMRDTGLNKKTTEFAQHITQAGHRARDLVHQLLAFGRKQTLNYKSSDLNDIINRFENLLRRTIREDIELEFLLQPNDHTIMADSGQIEQVIMNLCVNAQDAMPEGGKLTLTTDHVEIDQTTPERSSDTLPGTYVLLSIKDTGCGMSEEVQEHIFEPFYSTKGTQGTGLGLSTVYGIVKQHKGDLWVSSSRGHGSEFRIYLPVAPFSPDAAEIIHKAVDTPQGTERILLVEDNEQVRNLNNLILTEQGYQVRTAVDGTDALQVLDSNPEAIDLLLTDVVMPGMNGRELYSRISKKFPDMKVVYMSGYTDDVIAHHGVLDEGIHFIQKPFSIDALTLKIRQVIESC